MILGRIKLYGALLALAAIVAVGLYAKGRVDGRVISEGAAAKETVERVEAGSKGAAKARQAQRQGRTPEQGVRSRDGAWE